MTSAVQRLPPLPADMRLLGRTFTGKFYCRIRRDGGKYVDARCVATHEEAVARRTKLLQSMQVCIDPNGITVGQCSEQWVNKLWVAYEKSKTKTKTAKDALENLTSHVNAHIRKSGLTDIPVQGVTQDDINEFVEWLGSRDTQRAYNGDSQPDVLSRHTRRRIAVTLRKLFDAAVADGECKVSPVGKIKLGKDARAMRRVAHEVPLTKEDQRKLIAAYNNHPDVHMVILIIWIGLRLGELLNLETCDVHIDEEDPSDPTRTQSYIDVKYGGPNHQPPKGGKTRRVELFGEAKRVARIWKYEVLPKYAPHNPHGLFFPTRQVKSSNGRIRFRGGARRAGPPPSWKKLQKAKVLGRRFWWHALRHTCATSLLNNWFGLSRRWTIEEVANVLGHSSKEVTEMYAHLVPGMRDRAAEEEEAYQRKVVAAAGEETPPPAPPAATAPALIDVPPTPALAPPAAAEGSMADAIQALLSRAMKEKDAATAQALFAISMQHHGMTAPVVTPAPAPPPVLAPVPAPVQVSGPMHAKTVDPAPQQVALPRPLRKGPAGRRLRATVASEGDTEGPRKGGDHAQLAAPATEATRDLGWFPPSSVRAMSASGLSSETLATTIDARRTTTEPGTTGVLLGVHPSLVHAIVRETSTTVAPNVGGYKRGVPGVHPAMGVHLGCTPGTPPSPGAWQWNGNGAIRIEQFPAFSWIERRSTEPKVGGSNPPGRAEQYQALTTFPATGHCQAIAKPGAETASCQEALANVGHTARGELTLQPAWLGTLQHVESGESSDGGLLHPAPMPAPPLGALTEPAATAVGPKKKRVKDRAMKAPPTPPGSSEPEHLERAQRVMRFAMAGRQDARREAEELASCVLLSSADRAHHDAARLVLRDAESNPDLTIPRGLQLAVQLIGGAKKRQGRKPKPRS